MAQLIDYVSHLLRKNTTTFGSELEAVGEYLFGPLWGGVYATNQKINDGRYCIVNTTGPPGEHWYAVATDGFVYDSLQKNGFHDDMEQYEWETNCGSRALAWMLLHHIDSEIAKLV